MNTNPLLDDATLALATITLGVHKLREIALGDTAGRSDQDQALAALFDDTNRDHTALRLFADLVSDIADRLRETGAEDLADHLDETAGFIGDSAGLAIHRVREALVKTCQVCGQQKDDVEVMEDPFTKALDPDDERHELMTLCALCARDRFEDS